MDETTTGKSAATYDGRYLLTPGEEWGEWTNPSGAKCRAFIEAGAIIGARASIGARAIIGADAFIGAGARIGAGAIIGADARPVTVLGLPYPVTIYFDWSKESGEAMMYAACHVRPLSKWEAMTPKQLATINDAAPAMAVFAPAFRCLAESQTMAGTRPESSDEAAQ